MALTREQLIQNIEAMEQQGAGQVDVQDYINSVGSLQDKEPENIDPYDAGASIFGRRVPGTGPLVHDKKFHESLLFLGCTILHKENLAYILENKISSKK